MIANLANDVVIFPNKDGSDFCVGNRWGDSRVDMADIPFVMFDDAKTVFGKMQKYFKNNKQSDL